MKLGPVSDKRLMAQRLDFRVCIMRLGMTSQATPLKTAVAVAANFRPQQW